MQIVLSQHYSFRARLWPTLLTAGMIAVMVGLGCWQIQRLHWKEGLLVSIAAHKSDAPVNIQGLSARDTVNYRHAMALGSFDTKHNFFLISTSLKGEGGYHVLTPFQLYDGSHIIIDRGWIPYSMKDKPDEFIPRPGSVLVSGLIIVPQHGWLQPSNHPDTNDWYWPDLTAMARLAGDPSVRPYILDAGAAPNPSGYPVGGQTRLELPNNHLEYALTWFGLALALMIIYVVQGFNRTPKD